VRAGTSVTNSANYVDHRGAPSITLSSTGSPWSTSAPSGYPSSSSWPSGGVYPRPVHNGPHPVVPASCNSTVSPTQTVNTTAGKTGGAKATVQPSGQIAVKACVATAQ
jgi:hypothetical protein